MAGLVAAIERHKNNAAGSSKVSSTARTTKHVKASDLRGSTYRSKCSPGKTKNVADHKLELQLLAKAINATPGTNKKVVDEVKSYANDEVNIRALGRERNAVKGRMTSDLCRGAVPNTRQEKNNVKEQTAQARTIYQKHGTKMSKPASQVFSKLTTVQKVKELTKA